MAQKPAGEMICGRKVLQVFRATSNCLSVISPVIATYRSVQTSHLRISLHELDQKAEKALARLLYLRNRHVSRPTSRLWRWIAHLAARRLLSLVEKSVVGETQECCNAVYDGSPLDLFLETDQASGGKLYLLKMSSPDGVPGNSSTIWLCDDANRIGGHVWCSVGGSDQGDFGVMAHVGYASPISDNRIPQYLLISTTTQCNLNCIHCVSRWTRNRVDRLSPEIRLQIKRWCDEGLLKFADTDYSGDILWSDSRFGGDLDFFLGLDIPFNLNTSGTHLTRDVARRLMSSRIVSLNVSLDAARDESYRRVRKGAPPLEQVIANVRGVAEERRSARRCEVRLSLSFTIMRSTLAELSEIIVLARDTGFDMVIARHLEAYTADMAEESCWWDQLGFNKARDQAIAVAADLGIELSIEQAFEPRPERHGHRYCPEPWQGAVVLGNGDVNVCCVPGAGMRMGNLHEQSMEEIWNGPAYQHFRAVVNSATPPPACAACPIHRKRNNPASYMPYVVKSVTTEGITKTTAITKRHVPNP